MEMTKFIERIKLYFSSINFKKIYIRLCVISKFHVYLPHETKKHKNYKEN